MAPKPYTLDKVAIRMVKEPPLYRFENARYVLHGKLVELR